MKRRHGFGKHVDGKEKYVGQWQNDSMHGEGDPIPCRTVPYHTIPYHTLPYRTIPYRTVPYHTIPYHIVPYHTIPYHTIPLSWMHHN